MPVLNPEDLPLLPLNLLLVEKKNRKLIHYYRRHYQIKFSGKDVYDIAIGQKGYETPEGAWFINTKRKCPKWWVPNSPWVEPPLKPGMVIEGCTDDNPLKARWLGITDSDEGVGIHGTSSDWSIGTKASHGCIRMYIDDVIYLFDQIDLGTPIIIK